MLLYGKLLVVVSLQQHSLTTIASAGMIHSPFQELKIMVYCNYLKHQNHSSLTSIEDHNVPGETLPSLTPDFDLP